jgi:hypothetical protein
MKKIATLFLLITALAGAAEEVTLPKFIKNTNIKGDFRFRYENSKNEGDETARERGRVRIRLGFDTKVNEKWNVAYRFTSDNITLTKPHESKSLMTDYAYAKYSNNGNCLYIGRFTNPLFILSDILWDYNMEGAAFSKKISQTQLTAAYLIKEEVAKGSDPSIALIQVMQNIGIRDNSLKGELSYYNQMAGGDLPNITTAGLEYTHAIGIEKVMEQLKIRTQYILSDADENNKGYSLSLLTGTKTLSEVGNWQVLVEYKLLEKEAWIENLGAVALGKKQLKFNIEAAIAKSSVIEAAYLITDNESGTTAENKTLQVNLKHYF